MRQSRGSGGRGVPLPHPDSVVETTVRVRYAETDQMGVVNHVNYLIWFEVARSEFCRARGIDYAQMERAGYYMPIVEAHCRYIAPAHYDEQIVVECTILAAKPRALRIGYTVRRENVVIATGETYQIVLGSDKRPSRLPPNFAAIFAPNADDEQ